MNQSAHLAMAQFNGKEQGARREPQDAIISDFSPLAGLPEGTQLGMGLSFLACSAVPLL